MLASRREFLYGLGAISGSMLFAMERSEPELILHNGNFWTVMAFQSSRKVKEYEGYVEDPP